MSVNRLHVKTVGHVMILWMHTPVPVKLVMRASTVQKVSIILSDLNHVASWNVFFFLNSTMLITNATHNLQHVYKNSKWSLEWCLTTTWNSCQIYWSIWRMFPNWTDIENPYIKYSYARHGRRFIRNVALAKIYDIKSNLFWIDSFMITYTLQFEWSFSNVALITV